MDFITKMFVKAQNWQQRSDHDRVRADPVGGRGGRVRRLQDHGHHHHRLAHQRSTPTSKRQPITAANQTGETAGGS